MNTRHIKAKAFAFGLASIIALAPIAAEAQMGTPVLPNPRENPENSGGGTGNLRSREGAPVLGQDRAGYAGKRKSVKRSTRANTAKRKSMHSETTGTVRPRPAGSSMDSGTMNNSTGMSNQPQSSGGASSSSATGPGKAAPTGPNAAPQ